MTPQATAIDDFAAAFAGEMELPPLRGALALSVRDRNRHQGELREGLAEELYGPIPSPPDAIHVSRHALAGEQAERLSIDLTHMGRRFSVDAALWLPPDSDGSVPLICGLDFVGPVGVLNSTEFPIDPHVRISSRAEFGARDTMSMTETLRGTSAYRWPISMMLNAGYGVLLSCYGSWVPDDAVEWKTHGLYPLLGCSSGQPTGAISLWAWAIQRLLDAATSCDEIDMSRVAVAGHSRLGKAALWAAANDARIGAVLANNSGCGGAAPAAHPVGETPAQMVERFPHWTINHANGAMKTQTLDQHHLLASIAPRAVYVASAKADLWSDPLGSYMALRDAARFWRPEHIGDQKWPSPRDLWQSGGPVRNGPLGTHLRPGGHDLLPFDWRMFLEFLETR